MRIGLILMLLLASLTVQAEQYICTYAGFTSNKPVFLKIQIDGNKAFDVEHYGQEYSVLQNTKTGIILVRSFAEYSQHGKRDEVGLFGLAINKNTLELTRGNIIQGDSDGAVRHCAA